jgi:hypothetical protein
MKGVHILLVERLTNSYVALQPLPTADHFTLNGSFYMLVAVVLK